MPLIRLGARRLDEYADSVGPNVLTMLRNLAAPLAGLRILHLSAGPYGSAVADTLAALVPLQRDLGLQADWHLLRGDAPRVWSALYEGLSGKPSTAEGLLAQSERVYNFQRLLALRLGFGTREFDTLPYRAKGPVTVDEYESRVERYDRQLAEEVGLDPEALTVEEKVAALRRYREARYEQLMNAVYQRRGWNANGIPTLKKVRELGIDLPEIVALLAEHGVTE